MRIFTLLLVLLSTLSFQPAMAETSPIPPIDERLLADEAPFMVSSDSPTLVRLPVDAASVVVGNPEHAQAMVENPRLVVLLPRRPGATSITVLDNNGKLIMNRKILVGGSQKTGTLRINRVCKPGDSTCAATKVYNCTGRCYETLLPNEMEAGTIQTDTPPAPVPLAAPATSQLEQEAPIPESGDGDQ